jgi:hypothetical protein
VIIPTLALKSYLGCLEPMGSEHIFEFKRYSLVTSTIESSNQIILRISMAINNDDPEIEVGVPSTLFKKLLPKSDDTFLDVCQDNIGISSGNYRAELRSVVKEQCRRPSKPILYPEFCLPINPSGFHEKLESLSKVFSSGKQKSLSFAFETQKDKPNIIFLGDSDIMIGSIKDALPCLGSPAVELAESYPYDTTLPVLDAIRHLTQSVNLHFMPMPGGGCNALVMVGQSDDRNNTINFMYLIAPRLRE